MDRWRAALRPTQLARCFRRTRGQTIRCSPLAGPSRLRTTPNIHWNELVRSRQPLSKHGTRQRQACARKQTDHDLKAIYEYLRSIPSLPDDRSTGPSPAPPDCGRRAVHLGSETHLPVGDSSRGRQRRANMGPAVIVVRNWFGRASGPARAHENALQIFGLRAAANRWDLYC